MPVVSCHGHPSRDTLVAMPERIVATDTLDLLSHVPELIGFEPERSLVLITMSGSTTCGTFRVDVPDRPACGKRGRHADHEGENSRDDDRSATHGRHLSHSLRKRM